LKEYKHDHSEIIIFPFFKALKELNGVKDSSGPYPVLCSQNVKMGELVRDSMYINSENNSFVKIESNYYSSWTQGNWYRYTSYLDQGLGYITFVEFFRNNNIPFLKVHSLIKASINGVIYTPPLEIHPTTWLEIKQGK
jgi:hypothetical protein